MHGDKITIPGLVEIDASDSCAMSCQGVMFDQYAVDAMRANKSTYLTLKSSSKLRIVRYTDNAECSASACDSLSLRRERLVCDWLLAHGLPARRLLLHEGHGAKSETRLSSRINRVGVP
jgi:hypothetical protein